MLCVHTGSEFDCSSVVGLTKNTRVPISVVSTDLTVITLRWLCLASRDWPAVSCHRASILPLPTSRSRSPRSRSLRTANNQNDSTIEDNEAVSTSIAIRGPIIVADHIPSIHLDGVVLRFSFYSYRSTRETSRNYSPRRSKTGLYTEIVCRQ